MNEMNGAQQGKKQILYILAPLIFVAVCLGVINFAPLLLGETAVSPSAVSENAEPTANVIDSAVPGLETAVPPTQAPPTATPTPLPTPTIPPEAVITLLGPPTDSHFRAVDTISFYWHWPLPLSDDQQLAVYARVNGQDMALGTLSEANLGRDYRLDQDAAAILGERETAVSLEWFVQLQLQSNANPQHPLRTSDVRTIQITP